MALARMISGDVFEGMQVQANGTANMTVVVGQGSCSISTGTYPSSFRYTGWIDTTSGSPAGESVTITTAPTSNSRIDTIVAYVDVSVTTSAASANNASPAVLKLAAIAGTVSASPTAPSNGTIQSAIGASNPYIKLGNVAVGTNVTQINSGNITDLRSMVFLMNRAVVSTSTAGASTTSGTSYGNLADAVTTSVTVNVSASGILRVDWSAECFLNEGATTTTAYASVALSGANTAAAADSYGLQWKIVTASTSPDLAFGTSHTFTGLTPGATTITLQYRCSANNNLATFTYRNLSAVPL